MMYLRTELRSAAVLLSLVSSGGVAHAIEIDTGNPDLNVRWDNTVKYNYAHRVEGQDRHILASPNNDDGDRNFDKGTVSNRIDLFSELDFIYKNKAGFRVSGAAWYDDAYRRLDNNSVATSNHIEGGLPASGLSNTTERFHQGPSGEILDAFVFGRFDLGDMPVNLKLGRHSIFWGEALLSPIHGVGYGQAPLDLRKALSVPGTEAKELLLPRNAISAQIQVNPELSLAAQYFLDWKPFRLPEAGSYLGSFDMLVDGGESLIAGPGARFLRGKDVEPKEIGDWGLSARWSPEWLDASLGFYYRKTSDIQPQLHITPAVATVPAANCGALGFAPLAPSTCYINPSAASVPQLLNGNIGQYHLVYPGDVDVFGFSLSKNIGGISVGTDLSYRVNMPLASDAVLILPDALAAFTPGAISALPSDGNTGGAVGNTLHGVINLLGIVGRTPLFDQADWIAELQWNRWTSVKDGEAVFKGRSGYEGIDKVSKDFFGLAVTFRPTWFQVFPGVDLQMPIAYSTGLSGNSAVSAGGNEHAGSYSIGVGADVYQKYKFDLSYVDFFGSYRTNDAGEITSSRGSNALMGDRGFLSFTFKTSF
jgi:hypothetical protein